MTESVEMDRYIKEKGWGSALLLVGQDPDPSSQQRSVNTNAGPIRAFALRNIQACPLPASVRATGFHVLIKMLGTVV